VPEADLACSTWRARLGVLDLAFLDG